MNSIDIGEVVRTVGPRLLTIVGVLIGILILKRMLLNLLGRRPTKFTPQLTYLTPKVIWTLGIMVLLGSIGVNITSFLALFATIGLGAALVFTPVGQGLIAGFLAGLDDLVREGDVIDVLGRPGTVVRKGPLSVSVEFPDGSLVYMPNVKVIDDEMISHSRVDGARVMVEVKLNLDPDRRRAVAVMEEALESLEGRRQDKPVAVHFTEIGANAFHYRCYAWTGSRMDEPAFSSLMLTTLVDALEDAGISCGETSDLSMANWPEGVTGLTVDLDALEGAARGARVP